MSVVRRLFRGCFEVVFGCLRLLTGSLRFQVCLMLVLG